MMLRKSVLVLLCLTVLAPIFLYTDRLANFSESISKGDFVEERTNLNLKNEAERLHAVQQDSSHALKEPIGVVYSANSSNSNQISTLKEEVTELPFGRSVEHKSRVLSAADEGARSKKEDLIEQVIHGGNNERGSRSQNSEQVDTSKGAGPRDTKEPTNSDKKHAKTRKRLEQASPTTDSGKQQADKQIRNAERSVNIPASEKHSGPTPMPDIRVRQLKDQLIRARVYLGLASTRSNAQFIRELRVRIRDVQRALGDATKDSDLPKNINDKLKAMEQILAKGKQIQDDCSAIIKKLRAMLHSTEEQLRVHKKQTLFLTQLAAKTLPKGLHCLPLRLSTEYYSLSPSQQQFPYQEKLEDPKLFHYALFSDNILAAAVVVNSTVVHAKNPAGHVFHVVTDRLNYAAMRMWFLANPPGNATIQVQNIEEFTWLNSSYSPVLKQLRSQSMIDYYFRTHRTTSSDANLKYRNPKYLSILNHLRFYLPEIFPKLNKVVFLDDDIVVQKDLTGLWTINMKGKVNGAVETCGENFHRFDRYLNFSNPLIAKNFNSRACGWAYGMNVFDLVEWRQKKITEVYHSWQNLNQDRLLWKLGTLPPGLITFWNQTFPLDKSWHVLGLGYNPNVIQKEIERAAVIHYNGNMKPWLEIGIPKYRGYWSKFVDYDQVFLRECNINP